MTTPAPVNSLRRLPALPGAPIGWPDSPVPPGVQGALALDAEAASDSGPEPAPHLFAVPGPAAGAGVAELVMRARAGRFAMAVVEAVGGDRPVGQLERWSTPQVYDAVAQQAAAAVSTTDAEARSRTERPRLLSLHLSRPADDVAEVCGHIRHGRRSRALALRLELRLDRWVCTALEIG